MEAFNEEELEQLTDVLELTGDELATVLETCSFFLEQAAYHGANKNAFGTQLLAAGVAQDKVGVSPVVLVALLVGAERSSRVSLVSR